MMGNEPPARPPRGWWVGRVGARSFVVPTFARTTAWCSAVCPSLSTASTWAPCFRRSFTTRLFPAMLARCRGVHCVLKRGSFTSTPLAISCCTTSTLPFIQAAKMLIVSSIFAFIFRVRVDESNVSDTLRLVEEPVCTSKPVNHARRHR